MIIRIKLEELPPSVNHAYYHVRMRSGRIIKVKTKEAKVFVEKVKTVAKELNLVMIPKTVKIGMQVYYFVADNRKHDIDNLNKVMIDALQGIVFEDDNQIYLLHCRKYKEDNKHGVEIILEPLEREYAEA